MERVQQTLIAFDTADNKSVMNLRGALGQADASVARFNRMRLHVKEMDKDFFIRQVREAVKHEDLKVGPEEKTQGAARRQEWLRLFDEYGQQHVGRRTEEQSVTGADQKAV